MLQQDDLQQFYSKVQKDPDHNRPQFSYGTHLADKDLVGNQTLHSVSTFGNEHPQLPIVQKARGDASDSEDTADVSAQPIEAVCERDLHYMKRLGQLITSSGVSVAVDVSPLKIDEETSSGSVSTLSREDTLGHGLPQHDLVGQDHSRWVSIQQDPLESITVVGSRAEQAKPAYLSLPSQSSNRPKASLRRGNGMRARKRLSFISGALFNFGISSIGTDDSIGKPSLENQNNSTYHGKDEEHEKSRKRLSALTLDGSMKTLKYKAKVAYNRLF